MGATVKPMASYKDMQAHDVVLVIKRVPDELLSDLRASGVPWVYDIVDAYPQPACSVWEEEQCREWLARHIKTLNPDRVVWPNKRMRDDSGRSTEPVVYHHYRPGIARNPLRKAVKCAGYEGSAKYLDGWLTPMMRECDRRGIRFVVNPAQLADLDIVVAMRGGIWDGYAQRHWKSNVKLANAHGSGTPFIGAVEDGYLETGLGCEYWADTPREFARALDWLESLEARQTVHDRFLAGAYSVTQAAEAMRCALKF
jgi:hypothetical protein